jgi:hypothetical protein
MLCGKMGKLMNKDGGRGWGEGVGMERSGEGEVLAPKQRTGGSHHSQSVWSVRNNHHTALSHDVSLACCGFVCGGGVKMKWPAGRQVPLGPCFATTNYSARDFSCGPQRLLDYALSLMLTQLQHVRTEGHTHVNFPLQPRTQTLPLILRLSFVWGLIHAIALHLDTLHSAAVLFPSLLPTSYDSF